MYDVYLMSLTIPVNRIYREYNNMMLKTSVFMTYIYLDFFIPCPTFARYAF